MTDIPATDLADTLHDWQTLVLTQDPVGPCRRADCDGTLRALPPAKVGGILWLEAECDTCHAGVGLPDGRRATPPASLRRLATVASMEDWRKRQAKDM